MQKCSNCSAPLQDLVEQCTFCGTVTERGVQARHARASQTDAERRASAQAAAQQQAAELARARTSAQLEVESSGKWALIASLVGLVCCLVPIGPVLAILFGLRARRLAHRLGLPNSSLATAGLTIGVAGAVLSVLTWVGVGVTMVKESKRKAELTAELGKVTNRKLELETACALTELELIETRYEDFSALEPFDCKARGELEVKGEAAVLRELSFKKSGPKVGLVSCLRYRKQWSVHQVRADDDCEEPPVAPKKMKHE